MASLPTDEEIRARAEQLALLEPGAALSPDVRRTVAKVLLDERNAPVLPPAAFEPVLLSRLTQPASGGMIRIDVLFIPTPKEG